MKAWPLLLLGIGACGEPPRRPPVTYVPIVRGHESTAPATSGASPTASPSPGGALGLSPTPAIPAIPAERESGTATSIMALSTAEPPPDTSQCFLKLSTGCCADSSVTGKRQGRTTVCPKGFIVGKTCKGIGKACK